MGKSIEDTQLLSSFDDSGYSDKVRRWKESIARDEIQVARGARRLQGFRLLGYLAAAILRIENLTSFCVIPLVASKWLDTFWEPVHPQIDDDAILRKNALNCLSDAWRSSMLYGGRHWSRMHSLAATACATLKLHGQIHPYGTESRTPTESEVNAVFWQLRSNN